jgi:hypothetical protein
MTYDEVSGSIKRVAVLGKRAPVEWAWAPGRAAFVGTDLEKVFLFQRNASGDAYTPTLIPGPGRDVLPVGCSWSPKGQWLAVSCTELGNSRRGALWLYRFGDKALTKTDVALDYRGLAWANEGLLCGTKDNEVLVIGLTAEKPSVVRTIPVVGELTAFYGVFAEQPLCQCYAVISLGDKTLADLDRPVKFRAMGTEKTIFVSASPKLLVAFDTAGNQIARTDPGKLIQFGSVKDADTVYGLADRTLVRVSVEKGTLKIQTVADLSDLTGAGPNR